MTKFYTIENNGVLIAENEHALSRFYADVFELPADYAPEKYIISDVEEEIIVPDFADVEKEVQTGEDEFGNPIYETVTVREQIGEHTETRTVKKLVPNPDYPQIALREAKTAKTAENDTKRDSALNAGVEYKGVLFDSDTDQKVNLIGVIESMPDDATITWYGMNNDALECTKEDLFNIGGLITALHSFCWTKNAEIKGAIADAKTVDEVGAIVIDYETEE